MGFDFDRMIRAFECIEHEFQSSSTRSSPQSLPSAAHFVTAMGEVLLLFETLGSAFTFVKRDIEKKLAIIARYASRDEAHFADLTTGVEYEIKGDSLMGRDEEGLPSMSRTLLRLMWACKFADVLLEGLGRAFDQASGLTSYDRTLKWAVSRAYDSALAEHHSWAIRRSVKSACLLLPTKESFMDRVGVKESEREGYMKRLKESMSPLVERMYAFYEENELLALP